MDSRTPLSRLLLLMPLLLPGATRAQLDLGSGKVSETNIDGHMEPFYRLLSAGLGAGRLPAADPEARFSAGVEAVAVPVPGGEPFNETDLSVLPLFRFRSGVGYGGFGVNARGLTWSDPRIGDMVTYGFGAAYVHEFSAANTWFPLPVSAGIIAGWDRMDFSSSYTYRYSDPFLGLFSDSVRGDYTLKENVLGVGAVVGTRWKRARFFLQGGLDLISGRFRYLYLDPVSEKEKTVASSLDLAGARFGAAASLYGFHLEAGWHAHPYLLLGWSWVH